MSAPSSPSPSASFQAEEFSFACQQLAAMLQSGIPLEGAIQQMAQGLKSINARNRWLTLEQDLSQGVPLHESLKKNQFPPLFITLIHAGQTAHDLPRMLTLLADHYTQIHEFRSRLTGILTYPIIVLFTSFAVSILVAFLMSKLPQFMEGNDFLTFAPTTLPNSTSLSTHLLIWTPPTLILLALAITAFLLLSRPIRNLLRWKLPGFKEASLSHLASLMQLLLQRGIPMPDALRLAIEMEPTPRMKSELTLWESRLAQGGTPFPELKDPNSLVPPLFKWLVASHPGDWSQGFSRAAELYRGRALYRMDLTLYGALPVAILFLSILIVGQFTPTLLILIKFMNAVGNS